MVMGFQFSGRVTWQSSQGPHQLSTAGITGILNEYRVFEYTPSLGSVLVYFKPLAAAAFLPFPANELQAQSISLYDIMPAQTVRDTEEKIAFATNDHQRIDAIEKFLLSCFNARKKDALAEGVFQKITEARGNIRVGALAKTFHISQRQLERRFRAVAGASPKQFASLVRFHQSLQQMRRQASLTALGYEAGYADQSHFNREFGRYTGTTPGKYFQG